jgi:hypothetical protein
MVNNQSMMMQQMTMFAASSLKQAEEKKKLKCMFSKTPEEDERLFDFLAADGWHDHKPRMPSFMRRLAKDKDVAVAWNAVRKRTIDWPGLIS